MAVAGRGGRPVTAIAGHAPARCRAFVTAVFAPRVHVTYGVLWAFAYEATAAGEPWRPTASSVIRAATLIAMLLFLRLVDERMDEPYDRVHNPDRPLVTGLVTVTELRRAGWVVAALVIAANAPLAPWSAVVAAALFGYAELLARLVLRFPALRDRPLAYLTVAYPVQLAAGLYLYASTVGTALVRAGLRPALLVLVFATAFLHFEFARKTVRRPAPGSRMYSATRLGPTGSAVVTLCWALLSCAVLAAVTRPRDASLVPYLSLVFPVFGAGAYLSGRTGAWPKATAMLFLVVLYAALILGGVLA
ncbi:hypothetical protein AB0J80_24820 [Actinoplanes sp. NPDC049548]|uniref:hypothetical protein n=1 Tax=Actinoplanes sp. NPDC049548 TaxID=3155152 RepID=UPI00341BCEB0